MDLTEDVVDRLMWIWLAKESKQTILILMEADGVLEEELDKEVKPQLSGRTYCQKPGCGPGLVGSCRKEWLVCE